jgi:dolichol-phosphate mannosyltransferase
MGQRPDLDVVVPVHDEASTIEAVLDELCAALSSWANPRVIVCEDGSSDGTPDVVHELTRRLPVLLRSSRERLGYASALLGGLEQVRTDYAIVIDGDGQYDPRDAQKLFERREHADIVLGRRAPRHDTSLRLLMSASFGAIYQGLFRTPVHDPSCSFALLRRRTVSPLLRDIRRLPYGFWWELVARAHAAGLTLVEQDVRHRARVDGASRAFPLRSIPRRSLGQAVGLGRLWMDLRS